MLHPNQTDAQPATTMRLGPQVSSAIPRLCSPLLCRPTPQSEPISTSTVRLQELLALQGNSLPLAAYWFSQAASPAATLAQIRMKRGTSTLENRFRLRLRH